MTTPARPLEIREFRDADRPAVDRLNERLRLGGAPDRVEPGPPGNETALAAGRAIRERLFLAVDGYEIRGGVWLKEQSFRAAGRDEMMGWAKYPVAESLVDPAFAGVPGALLFQLLREQPRLLALGMGGHTGPFARFLAKMKWAGQSVPLVLFLNRPSRVLRQYARLSSSPLKRTLLWLASVSGVASLGLALRGIRYRGVIDRGMDGVSVVEVAEFPAEIDQLWSEQRDSYGFLALRNADTLNALYPGRSRGVARLLVRQSGQLVGWGVVFHRAGGSAAAGAFGDLALGIIADGFAAPAHRHILLAACHRHLRQLGVDLILSNQSHPEWLNTLSRFGYIPGPDRFAFYQSPAVSKLLKTTPFDTWYITRGDCHGGDWA